MTINQQKGSCEVEFLILSFSQTPDRLSETDTLLTVDLHRVLARGMPKESLLKQSISDNMCNF